MCDWDLYSKEELEAIVANNYTYSDILRHFDKTVFAGNRETLKNYIKHYNIDVSHFNPNMGLKSTGGLFKDKIPDSDFLVNGIKRDRKSLKKRLKDYKPYSCEVCSLQPFWNGKKLTLQIDHIDGDSWNNLIENLRFICPNCHTQTDTYSLGKEKLERKNKCVDCKIYISKKAYRCVSCEGKRKQNESTKPNLEEIIQNVKTFGYVKTGEMYKCSDNNIRKWLKKYGVDPKNIKRSIS